MTSHPTARVPHPRPLTRALVPVAVALAGAAGLALRADVEPLHAAPFEDPFDNDLDGIPNAQEFVLGTSQFVADSDGDGALDCEELACGSNALDPAQVPTSVAAGELRVGITARGEDNQLRLHLALYSENGEFNSSVLRVGALANGQMLSVPFHRMIPMGDLRDVDLGNGAVVRTIDLAVSPAFVHALGGATLFVAVGAAGSTQYHSAAKVDLASLEGTLLLRRPVVLAQQGSPVPGGSLRQPIPTSGSSGIPTNWLAGQICYQRSSVTGMVGAKVVHEIVSSTCLSGWDTYCPSDCSASIGNSYETIDPAALLGN